MPPLFRSKKCSSHFLCSHKLAYGSSAVLKSPRDCTMLTLSMRRVGLIDITGRHRDAPRRIATFLHATLRVAPHRYATREPPGKPGGSRAFGADGLLLGVVRSDAGSAL